MFPGQGNLCTERDNITYQITDKFGLSLGARPPFVLGSPSSHPGNYGPYPPAPQYATHPYSHGHHSYVTPCFSPQFQLLTNFYGDYFKPGVLCSTSGFDHHNVIGPGYIRGGASGSATANEGAGPPASGLPGGIVLKSFTDQNNDEAPGDSRSGLCDKVPKVCQLLSKNEDKKSRSLQPTSPGPTWFDSVRQNLNSLYSFVTRRSTSYPSSPYSPQPTTSPLFSLLSGPAFSQQMREPLQTVFRRPVGVHDPSWGDGAAGDPCSPGGCTDDSEGQQSVRLTGSNGFPAEALDEHLHHPPAPPGAWGRGLSVCEESEGVAYPLVGVSALSGQPVRLLQQHPFMTQPVFFRRCRPARTPLLSGRCEQQYLAVAFLVDEPSFKHRREGRRSSQDELKKLDLTSEGINSEAFPATMTPQEALNVVDRSKRILSTTHEVFKHNQIRKRSGNQPPLGPSKTAGGRTDTPSTETKTQKAQVLDDHPKKQASSGEKTSDEAGDRFSLSFLDSLVHSGSDHHQQFAVPPLFGGGGGGQHGQVGYPPYQFGEHYRQDYVMVEAGCRVVIDLPHVRRDSKPETGGETVPAGDAGS